MKIILFTLLFSTLLSAVAQAENYTLIVPELLNSPKRIQKRAEFCSEVIKEVFPSKNGSLAQRTLDLWKDRGQSGLRSEGNGFRTSRSISDGSLMTNDVPIHFFGDFHFLNQIVSAYAFMELCTYSDVELRDFSNNSGQLNESMTPFIMAHGTDWAKTLAAELLNYQSLASSDVSALWKQRRVEMGGDQSPNLAARLQEIINDYHAENTSK